MRADDLILEVRDRDLRRTGRIPTGLLSARICPTYNGVGSWEVSLPADHPRAIELRRPGAGLLVIGRDDRVLLSGPTTKPSLSRSPDDPAGLVTISGVSDDIILSDALAWPQPGNPNPSSQTAGWDNRSGPAESVLRAYVGANIGPTAPSQRRSRLASRLRLQPDQGRGMRVVRTERFTNLLELCQQIGTLAKLGFRVIQVDDHLELEIWEPSDHTSTIRLDILNGTLSDEQVEMSPPDVTYPIVLGQGQGDERRIITQTTPEATEAQEAWGRIIEQAIDQRQAETDDELYQAAAKALAEGGFTAVATKAIPADGMDVFMELGVDYWLGDTVTTVVDGQETTAQVTGAALIANSNSLGQAAALGDISGFDTSATMSSRVEDTARRISALERNAEQAAIPDPEALGMTGEIRMWGGSTAPTGWLVCDGATISRSTYAALFAAIGTAFGAGDGSTTFRIPNLVGRVPMGVNGTAYPLGSYGGEYAHTLTVAEMPSHTHTQNAHTHTQASHTHTYSYRNSNTEQGGFGLVASAAFTDRVAVSYGSASATQAATPAINSTTAVNQVTGGGQAHNVTQPYTVVTFIIKT